ncbi:class III lanthionine synthetase LanKC [Streptomyces sp. NPDC006450]|uniref:class III lanthionine synthetase LanKC n=1 Tax=Streptomyces sp. NPDC006450 TaxID=3155458 RepID=UPI0033BB5C50
MSLRHVAHCPPGTPFYDRPAAITGADAFPAATAEAPAGWTREPMGEWTVLTPPGLELPGQGWKIHVSATERTAPEVLDIVSAYCTSRSLLFKFLTSPSMLMLRNSKYGDRGSSGKFITLYPRDEAELETVLTELDALLEGRPGPAVLSDLRWGAGPLYIRYGGFKLKLGPGPNGAPVPCIEDPDGNLVPDVRGPSFRPPAWLQLPPCVVRALAERSRGGSLGDFPFKITQALHFSNGGGVYRATDTRDGHEVLVKEGRPHAGLDDAGADAVERLRREHDALAALDGLPWFPRVLDWRRGAEHWFLTREFVDGNALTKETAERNPMLHPVTARDTAMPVAEYTAWALDVLDRIEAAVTAMHERGLVFGDLHPNNVLIRPDGTVAFIDLETTLPIDGHTGQAIGAPGFCAPAGTTGTAVDRYALGCLRLSLFLPLTPVMSFTRHRSEDLLAQIAAFFPVPEGYADQVRADLGHAPAPAGGPLATPERIATGILTCATPEREDRLFPGDADQFLHGDGGLNIANGAAGVLWALRGAGISVPEAHLDWLADAARAVTSPRPGLYDGLAGIACVLHDFGRTDEAAALLDRAHGLLSTATLRDGSPDRSLSGGIAGLGLALLHLGEDAAAHELAAALVNSPTLEERPGLLRGASGEALFLLAAGRDDAARVALVHDLELSRQPLPTPWHRVQLAHGGAGQAIAVHHYLAAHRDPYLTAVHDALRADLTSQFHPACGLFTGRAGALAALTCTDDGSAATARALAELRSGLEPFAVAHENDPDATGFLGDHLLRLSTDLATGSAGVLAALTAPRTAVLPYLPALVPAAAPVLAAR